MIIGLDLSLRAAAACSIPFNWDEDFRHDMRKVQTQVWGGGLGKEATLAQRHDRIVAISSGIVSFCHAHRASRVFVEEYAFNQGTGAYALGELGGVIKYRLYTELRMMTVSIVASRARKVLLQKLPRKDIKAWVVANVKRLPETSAWTPDEVDAFVVANAGLELAGGTAMSFKGEA